jgi:ribose transport system permease protein
MSSDQLAAEKRPDSGHGGPSHDAAPSRAASVWSEIQRVSGRSTGVIAGLVILCIYLAATQPVFATWGNVTNVVAGNSVVLLLAIGATFVILSGGIDLSTAAAGAATAIIFGELLSAGVGALVAVAGTLAFGLFLGAVNGVLISYLKIPFLVVTLGTLSIFESFALVVSSGKTINTFTLDGFEPVYKFTLDDVAGVPYLLIFDVVVVVVAALVLRYTSFGRGVYAIGSNSEAARLNGINVARTTLMVYVIAGLCAGLAALVQVGRLTGASPNIDSTLLLTVIAAVLIGGTAYTGGEGGVGGTVLGVLFLGVIQNGLTLTDVSTFWRGTVNGLVLIVAVALGVGRDRGWFRLPKGGRRG